jgi:hypothetical protein
MRRPGLPHGCALLPADERAPEEEGDHGSTEVAGESGDIEGGSMNESSLAIEAAFQEDAVKSLLTTPWCGNKVISTSLTGVADYRLRRGKKKQSGAGYGCVNGKEHRLSHHFDHRYFESPA